MVVVVVVEEEETKAMGCGIDVVRGGVVRLSLRPALLVER